MVEEITEHFNAFVWVFVTLVIGAFMRNLNRRYRVPYTPSLMFIGLAWGLSYKYLGILGQSAKLMSEVNPVLST